MNKSKRERVKAAVLMVERGLAESVERAGALIMAGEVRVEGERLEKPGTLVDRDADLALSERAPFVSRGGVKLSEALLAFEVSVNSAICADVGSSTGGFTDALLQAGAKRVYAIDTAFGELAWKLRSDERVEVLERTDVLSIDQLDQPIDIVTIDLSLMSVQRVVPKVEKWLSKGGTIICLLKPQYEALPDQLPDGAVIRDTEVHRRILKRALSELEAKGFAVQGIIRSPITGRSGNIEFLLHLKPGGNCALNLDEEIERVLQ